MIVKYPVKVCLFCMALLSVITWVFLFIDSGHASVIDTYYENFDDWADEASINGIDYWAVYEGELLDAVTQDAVTYSGSGKALELIGSETPVYLKRDKNLSGVSPCWIEFIVNPGKGAQEMSVPEGKICAVNFDYRGTLYASDGSSWVDTGEKFTLGNWYRIILKLNFDEHRYDIYIESPTTPLIEFTPVKENLDFIDNTISSLSEIGFSGAYNTTETDDSFVDNLIIYFIDRLEIITSAQSLIKDKPSNKITVQLQDAYSEPQTAWRDITLDLISSSKEGEFSLSRQEWLPVFQVTIPEEAQQVSFYYKDSQAGKPTINIHEYPDRGWQDAFQQLEVVPEAKSFDVTTTKPQVAGGSFDLEITAKDENGNINKNYDGIVDILTNYIQPAGGTKTISPLTASGFKEGKLEIAVMYPDCGIIEIRVQDQNDPSKNGTSGQILFIPAAFKVEAESPQTVDRDFTIKVSSLNTNNEVTQNYNETTGFGAVLISPESIPAGDLSLSEIGPEEFTKGKAQLNVSYNGWGKIKIKVYDKQYPIKIGESGAIQFYPDSLLIDVTKSGDRDFFYVGEEIPITMSVLGYKKEPIFNYLGTINTETSIGLDLPSSYQFTKDDAGSHKFSVSASSPGVYEASFEDTKTGLKSDKIHIEVKSAALEVISTVAPIGETEVIIKLVDDEGNIIDSENSLGVNVEIKEEFNNHSVTSPAILNAVTFNHGIAKILVSNSQAEIVTITPSTSYDLEVKKGIVIFGRISKTGIGTLMWREIKK